MSPYGLRLRRLSESQLSRRIPATRSRRHSVVSLELSPWDDDRSKIIASSRTTGVARLGTARREGLLGVLEAEAELQAHLNVANGAVLDVTPDFGNLKPVEVTSGLRRSFDRVADGAVDG